MHAVTEGTDAQAEVSVRLSEDGRAVTARGADPDTLVASAKAYLGALNKLVARRSRGRDSAARSRTADSLHRRGIGSENRRFQAEFSPINRLGRRKSRSAEVKVALKIKSSKYMRYLMKISDCVLELAWNYGQAAE